MTHSLHATQLRVGYNNQPLGKAFDFQLPEGQLSVLLGANGSGKTTFLKTMLGLLKPVSGIVKLADRPMTHWTARQRAQQIAYVAQSNHSYFSYTCLEMVLMGRNAYLPPFAQPGNDDQEIAWHCLQQLHIQRLANRSFNQLSGGEQQLVMLARALAQQAQILILDEPTASLDFANQILVLEHLRQLRLQGLSVLVSTHQPGHALQIADNLLLFKQGTLARSGPVSELGTLEQVAWLYNLDVEQVSQAIYSSQLL